MLLQSSARLQVGGGWLRRPRYIIIWSLIAFLAFAKYGYFTSIYVDTLDTWKVN